MRNSSTADVGTTLRDMWETRPARPRRDRKIAGVAAAIARRYDIDPVLVRVGFAVAAVYGVGIALYVAGWLLLPAADERDPLDGAGPRPASGGVHPAAWAGLGVLVLATGGVFWGDDGGFVLPVLAVLVLLFFLHRSRGSAPAGPTADDAAPGVGPAASPDSPVGHGEPGSDGADGTAADRGTDEASSEDASGAPTTRLSASAAATGGDALHVDPLDRGTPPGWDPLGAAPFAWDLPEPAQPEPEPVPVRRRSRVTPVTLALALVGGGAAGAIVLLTAGIAGLPIVFATALAIVGLGLVVGAFARGGRGLIPFALILGLLTWGSVVAREPLQHITAGGVGDITVAPTSAAALLPSYERGAGTISLDLSGLDTSAPAGTDATPIRTAATVGLGTIEVTVPPNADVTLRARAELGDVTFGAAQQESSNQSGTDAVLTVVDDLGADGVRSGRPIELDLQAGLGSVEVRRG